jgi:hypothetical protein
VGRPFVTGDDPRRGVGKPGRSGRPKDVVRACRRAFDKRIGILSKIADGKIPDTSPGDRIRALDVLARYGGMVYTEAEIRAEATLAEPSAKIVVYALPSDGRGAVQRAAPPSDPSPGDDDPGGTRPVALGAP